MKPNKSNKFVSLMVILAFLYCCVSHPGFVFLVALILGSIEAYSRLTSDLSTDIKNAKEKS